MIKYVTKICIILISLILPLFFIQCVSHIIPQIGNANNNSNVVIADTVQAKKYLVKIDSLIESDEIKQAENYTKSAADIYYKLELWEKYISAFYHIGNLLTHYDYYDKAEFYLTKALDLGKKFKLDSSKTIALTTLRFGQLESHKGNYKKSIAYINNALDLYIKIYGRYCQGTASCYNSLGLISQDMGDYINGITYYQNALDILSKLDTKEDRCLAIVYNNLGESYHKLNDYDKALELYQRALNIRKKILDKNSQSLAINYCDIADIYQDKEDYINALPMYHKALRIWESHEKSSFWIAWGYRSIGWNYKNLGRYEEALDYFNKALRIANERFDKDNPQFGKVYWGLSGVYLELGDIEKSEEYIYKALDIYVKNYGEKHQKLASIYTDIGTLYLSQNSLKKALQFFQKAIIASIDEFNDESIYSNPEIEQYIYNCGTEIIAALGQKALAFSRLYKSGINNIKDLETACSTYKLTVEILDSFHRNLEAYHSKVWWTSLAHSKYEEPLRAFYSMYKITNDHRYLDGVFFLLEKNKSRTLRGELVESKAKKYANVSDSLLRFEKKLKTDLIYLDVQFKKALSEKKSKPGNFDENVFNHLEKRYYNLKSQYENLIKDIEKKYPKYYELKYQTKVASVTDIQKIIDNETALLEFFLGDSAIFISVITNDIYDVTNIALDSTTKSNIIDYYKALKKVEKKNFLQASSFLYKILIEPVRPFICNKSKLVIIPDGLLNYIPFEALIYTDVQQNGIEDFTQLDYLIKDYEISYHYSATLWYKTLQYQDKLITDYEESILEKKQPKPLLVSVKESKDFIGFAPVFRDENKNNIITSVNTEMFKASNQDMDYRSTTVDGETFNELKYSEEELESILEMFESQNKKSAGYFHNLATEENFKKNISEYKYIHIATHGIMNEKYPDLSGLIFSQPSDTSSVEDGVLYAGEAYNLNLNADILTLSSCESGIGKLVSGEGLMALTRGFLYSGVKNIIVSLWDVYDKYTRDLMIDLYKNILNGNTYASSLRQAKLNMIKNSDTAFPGKWSGFVLIGR